MERPKMQTEKWRTKNFICRKATDCKATNVITGLKMNLSEILRYPILRFLRPYYDQTRCVTDSPELFTV